MHPSVNSFTEQFTRTLRARNPGEPEFHQAVQTMVESLAPVFERHPKYLDHRILERIVEPERVILFRVPWFDDRGEIQINKGYRVEFNSALGPYKGGLCFHPTVNLGFLKFLAFEEVFRNSLTTLPLGGGSGGSEFDPKGKSDIEVMRFCQSFMTELSRHIGPHTDLPSGGIGVGGREIGYLFGQYKRLQNTVESVFTGKGIKWGGSLIRPEATGYGAAYFAEEMLKTMGAGLNGKRVSISGSGNVAQHAAEKCLALGAKIVTFSDSSGFVVIDGGATVDIWRELMDLKNVRRGRIRDLVDSFPNVSYREGASVWSVACDVALACATQNEVDAEAARVLIDNGCSCVCEGATMASTPDAVELFHASEVLYGPSKAANAGGVVVAGLEMSQNSRGLAWSRTEVDRHLREVMIRIHESCVSTAAEYGRPGNYVVGANIAGFVKVADSMIDQGLI
jgi:glutamate dehydrogenase (NADP+)